MDVTLLGMVTEVRPLQSEKALCPMDVTLLGMVTVSGLCIFGKNCFLCLSRCWEL